MRSNSRITPQYQYEATLQERRTKIKAKKKKKSKRIKLTLPTKVQSQGYGFSSGHVWMWKLDCEEAWALKNWCFWTVVLEKTLESPLDCKEIQPVHSKGNQSWTFFGRTDVEAEASILWLSDKKSGLIAKDHDSRKDWRHKEKGTAEDEMVGWHHRLNGCEFAATPN